MGNNTSCILEGKHICPNGVVKLSMRMLTSDRNMDLTYELPSLMNCIRHSGILEDAASHLGFDYVLDFPMVEQNAFPYVLDFEIIR